MTIDLLKKWLAERMAEEQEYERLAIAQGRYGNALRHWTLRDAYSRVLSKIQELESEVPSE